MSEKCRPTKLYIDLNAITQNINNIKKLVGNKVEIMPVVKANGYGSYLNFHIEILNMFNYIAVALVDEAVDIRKIGYKKEILVLNPPVVDELELVLKYNLIINGCNYETLEAVNNLTSSIQKVHLELETGMGRTGINIDELDNFLEKVKKLQNIKVDGVFSHFAASSKNIDYSNYQISEFEKGLQIIKNKDIEVNKIHLCNSGALLNFKEHLYNMVRIGIMIYGYYPNAKLKDEIHLFPSMVLKTKINFIKTITKGTSVGYNNNFFASKLTKVATIPFGFADGLIGLETGKPYVIIKGQKAIVIGICMDNMMIDVTDIEDVNLETDVFIWDNDKLTIEEVANWCNGICNYEIISSLSERIPREFIS